MNFESLPYEANNMLDLPTWNGTSHKNELKADNISQAEWDLPSLNAFGNEFFSLDVLPNKSLKGTNSIDRISSKSPLVAEKQERTETELSDDREMQNKVDFFRKLGYSPEEISVVLLKLGVNADTNTVLGELVKHGPVTAELESVSEVPTDYCLVARGGGTTPNPPPMAAPEENEGRQFKSVVIDGSNLAMSHGNKEVFSCRGISLAVDWFLERGHTDITVFVPSWRKEQPRPDVPITDQNILRELEKKKILVFTPSRRVGGKRVVCYDDRFIVKLAYESDGIVVSNDTYRDLQNERPEWKKFIEERLLMYSFVNDKFMPPDDPLGRHGPSLDNFLRKKAIVPEHRKPQCPYGKKCTYGIKCKFYHPERLNQPQRSVADELRANARLSPTKSTVGIPNEEKRSRKSLHAEIISAVSRESDEVPQQMNSMERRNSNKVRGFVVDSSIRGRTSSSVSSHDSDYGSSEWHSQHTSHMDSTSYSSLDCADSGFVSSLESQMADMWTYRSNGNCEHNEQMGSCRYCVCSRERQTYHLAHAPNHDGYRHHHHQHSHHHLDYRKPIASSCSEGGLPPYIQDQAHARSPYSSHGFGRSEHQLQGKSRSLQNEYQPNSLTYYSDPSHYNSASASAPYCSEPQQMSHQMRSRDPRNFHGTAAPLTKWSQSDPFEKERLNTRTRLCGIFHPQLVDKVMNLNPHMVDPQKLAAEICAYNKSQNQGI